MGKPDPDGIRDTRYDDVAFVGVIGSAIVVGDGHRSDRAAPTALGGVAYFGTLTNFEPMQPLTPFAGNATLPKFGRKSGRFNFAQAWTNGGDAYTIRIVDGVVTAYVGDTIVDVYTGAVSEVLL